MAVGDRIYIADKETLDAVNTKCTTIQTYTNNLNSRLTSTRAGYLDYLANSTYGLNAIKNAINTVDGNVDSIRTYTTTNNTASKTGTLSQKEAYVINLLENTTYGLNAIKNSISSSTPTVTWMSNSIHNNYDSGTTMRLFTINFTGVITNIWYKYDSGISDTYTQGDIVISTNGVSIPVGILALRNFEGFDNDALSGYFSCYTAVSGTSYINLADIEAMRSSSSNIYFTVYYAGFAY